MTVKSATIPLAVLSGLLCGLAARGAAAAGPATPRQGGTLRMVDSSDIHSLDPILIYDWLEGIVGTMLNRTLLDYDENEQLVPMLAERLPKVSPDGLTYTFVLRPGAHFSNGREVVADDCVYSLERHLDPRNNSGYASYYANIAGAGAFKEARGKEPAAGKGSHRSERAVEPKALPGVRALDKYTLEIRLDKPDLVFADVLATPFSAIVPWKEVEERGAGFASHPIGAGPFVLDKWVHGTSIRLDRNPSYFRPGEPFLDHVDIQIGPDSSTEVMMFERGELDYLPGVPMADFVRLKRGPKFRRYMTGVEGGDSIYVSMNCELPPFTDVRVRRAINYAVNKQRVLKVLLNRGTIASGLLVPFVKGYNDKRAPYPYDPAKARALLAEAGHPNGFATVLTVASDTEAWMKAALVIQQDLAAVGVRVELRKVQGQATYVGQQRGKVPMEIWDWVPNFNDPKDTLDFLANGEKITDDNCINTAFYSNPEVNKLFHQGAVELDPAKRLRTYQEIEQRVFDDAPYLFLVNLSTYELHQPWLKGVKARGIWPRRLEKAWIDR